MNSQILGGCVKYLFLWIFFATVVSCDSGFLEKKSVDYVIVATEGAYPPFNYVSSKGQPQGFDVDLVLAVCEEIELKCSLVVQNWIGLIPGLEAHKYDMISASVSITEARKKVVLFSDPIYETHLAFLGLKDQDFSFDWQHLKNVKIGVQKGTISYDWLVKNIDDLSNVSVYETVPDVYRDLKIGRIDLALNDYISLKYFLDQLVEEDSEFQSDDFQVRGNIIYSNHVGFVFRKSDTQLRKKFNEGLENIRKKGIYDEIWRNYFGLSEK